MSWLEVRISVADSEAAMAQLVLEQHGALAVTLEDDADHPVLEPGPGATPLWPSVQVCGLFGEEVDKRSVNTALMLVSGINRPQQLRWSQLQDQDWTRAWMARFQPMQFGEHLWIVPTGMEIPHRDGNIEIRLDPGLAFGTGTHPTTALCLQWLDANEPAGQTVVDYGCGSGILGIAAALKGARRVICVDNDPQALLATADNAARNGVQHLVECQAPDAFDMHEADIMLANILAGPLIELAPRLLAAMTPRGRIVLSGILEEQAATVAAIYQPGCGLMDSQVMDGWVRLSSMGRGRT